MLANNGAIMNRPEKIYNVSQTQLSIARHYGGIKFNGAEYVYDATQDTLTRRDVWLDKIKNDKNAAKKERENWTKKQGGLF